MQEWYYVRNGQQQGPINLETLRNLAQEGGLGPDDLVWNTTMDDWIPASKVSGIFSRDTNTPPVAPSHEASAQGDSAELAEIEPGSEPLSIGACVSRGFELTKEHFGSLFLVGLTYFGVMLGAGIIMGIVDATTGMEPIRKSNDFYNQGSLINELVTNLVSIFLSLGAARIGLNMVDGKPFRVGMLFEGGAHFINALLAALLFFLMMAAVFIPVGLAILMGSKVLAALLSIVCCVGIIYLSLRFGYYLFAIVDKNMGPLEALTYSSKITTGQRTSLFFFSIVLFLLVLAGLLALIIGVIFTIPIVMIAWVVAYRWMQYGSRVTQGQSQPK